jgi:hypothetical protein
MRKLKGSFLASWVAVAYTGDEAEPEEYVKQYVE